MQPVIVIFCQHCKRMGHYSIACPDNPDNPENAATPEQQQRALEAMREMMRPASSWWLLVPLALLALVLLALT